MIKEKEELVDALRFMFLSGYTYGIHDIKEGNATVDEMVFSVVEEHFSELLPAIIKAIEEGAIPHYDKYHSSVFQ